ncbi:class I SAM-dependent methyltransferase [Phytomonospora sp. NPDC050363]|uniref:class I SAM-dependent methyltransferase n=1 Tax=Phytomonospora sp. NPDC050363 TaxID=3155642 RepID=UPI0033D57DFE
MTEPADVIETRFAYDTVAADYAATLEGLHDESPLEKALLAAFAEVVSGEVVEVGCGPGRMTGPLHELGVNVFGVDLSPGMVAVARERHPNLRFEVGSMAALDIADGTLGGVVAWYSIIHTPPERLPAVFAEFARVLAPGGHLLLAFQVGDYRKRVERGYGHEVGLDAYRLLPDKIVPQLAEAGFEELWRAVKQAEGDFEENPQAFVLLRKATAE